MQCAFSRLAKVFFHGRFRKLFQQPAILIEVTGDSYQPVNNGFGPLIVILELQLLYDVVDDLASGLVLDRTHLADVPPVVHIDAFAEDAD